MLYPEIFPPRLKIYEQWHGWAGTIVAVAKNEKDARRQMSKWANYNSSEPVVEHEIVDGLTLGSLGDL